MEVLFLGTGTSHGIPVIACDCETCTSNNPKNRRLRSSVSIRVGDKRLLIDTSIDLRQQCLRYNIRQVDAVLFTHHHVDHIFGLDDTRSFNRLRKTKLPCYGRPDTLDNLKQVYKYIFDYPDMPGGIPMLEFIPMTGPMTIQEILVQPIVVHHGRLPIHAYRIGNVIYATDCSGIPEESWRHFEGVEVLILDCLRHRPHPTHFHLEQAVQTAQRIGAQQTFFTHLSHDMEHERVSADLPPDIALAYDGLSLECEDPK